MVVVLSAVTLSLTCYVDVHSMMLLTTYLQSGRLASESEMTSRSDALMLIIISMNVL